MNDRMGDVTPVLTVCGGEAYERGANITTVEVHVPCRYLTTYLSTFMRCQQTSTATTYDFFLDPFFPLSSPTSLLIIHSEKGPWPGTDRTGCTWHVVSGVQVSGLKWCQLFCFCFFAHATMHGWWRGWG